MISAGLAWLKDMATAQLNPPADVIRAAQENAGMECAPQPLAAEPEQRSVQAAPAPRPAALRHTIPPQQSGTFRGPEYGCAGMCIGGTCSTCDGIADEISKARRITVPTIRDATEQDLELRINALRGEPVTDPMTHEEIEAFRENAPERKDGPLWSLIDWSFWGAGMADTIREPLADTMLAGVPDNVRAQAEAIMAEFIRVREIEKTGVTIYQEQRDELTRLRAQVQQLRDLTQDDDGNVLPPESELPVGVFYGVLYGAEACR